MLRARLLLTATAAAGAVILTATGAFAGCCNSGYGYGYGYSASYSYAPQVYVAQPIVQPAPVILQPVIVQQPVVQPVIVQQPVVQQVPVYSVNQGPVYSGFGPDYAPSTYDVAQPLGAYPYVSGNYGYRGYRYAPNNWRYRGYGVRRSVGYGWRGGWHGRVYRHASYRQLQRQHYRRTHW